MITDNLSDSNQHLLPLTVTLHSLVKMILLKSLIMGPKHCDATTYCKKPPPKSSRSLHRTSALPQLPGGWEKRTQAISCLSQHQSLLPPSSSSQAHRKQQSTIQTSTYQSTRHETAEPPEKPDLPKTSFFNRSPQLMVNAGSIIWIFLDLSEFLITTLSCRAPVTKTCAHLMSCNKCEPKCYTNHSSPTCILSAHNFPKQIHESLLK